MGINKPECSICQGFGKVNPSADGRVDYSRVIWCSCRPKAGQVCHPAGTHPDLAEHADIFGERIFDSYDRARQERYRGSAAFKSQLKERFLQPDVPNIPSPLIHYVTPVKEEQNHARPAVQIRGGAVL